MVVALALAQSGCVGLTPEGRQVSVYRAPLSAPPALRSMPGGCRLVAVGRPISMTELEIEGQADPYRVQRNEAAAAGANALLVLSEMLIPRLDSSCPASSPITDCPPSSGAWFRVVFESYTCTPDALRALSSSRAFVNTS